MRMSKADAIEVDQAVLSCRNSLLCMLEVKQKKIRKLIANLYTVYQQSHLTFNENLSPSDLPLPSFLCFADYFICKQPRELQAQL